MNISMLNKLRRIQPFFFCLLVLCFLSSDLYCFATEFIPEVDGKNVENLLRVKGSLEGVAFETFVNGKFYNTIGVLFINLNLNIKGRGSVELKNIGSEGIKLKKKYLANLNLGLMNPGLE